MDKFIKNKVRKALTNEEYKRFIGEGLIMTHSVDKVTYRLQTYGQDKYQVFSKDSGVVVVRFKTFDRNIDVLVKYMNNMGYYLSAYLKNGNLLKNYVGDDYEGLRFEPKFDLEYDFHERYMYHVTDESNLAKILKIGLTPRTKTKVTNHPERIYLALSEESLEEIEEMFVDFSFMSNPIRLKIDTSGLYNKYLIDTQFVGGVYTLHNIPPTHIEVIE